MRWFRQNPLFATLLALCGLFALAEIGLIVERWYAAGASAEKLVRKTQEMAALREVLPAPSRENARAIEADLARARQAQAAMQAELKGRGAAAEKLLAAKVPPARADAFFDLAAFVERTRESARRFEVEVRPDAARFGFAAFANEGPEPAYSESVFRQRQVIEFLVGALLEAKPQALLAVKREFPLTRKEREERDAAALAAAEAAASGGSAPEPVAAGPAGDGPDYFVVDPRASVRSPGFLDTLAFRLVFTGQTAALRTFLNRLAGFELPVLVREVEVEVATAEEAVSATEDAAPAEAVAAAPAAPAPEPKPLPKPAAAKPSPVAPIVPKPLSRFTVTVEFLELTNPPAPPADPAAPAPTS